MRNQWTQTTIACVIIAALVWLASGNPPVVGGGAAAGGGVGVVDVERLFTELQQVKDVDELMRARGRTVREEVNQKSSELEQTANLLDQLKPESPEGRQQLKRLSDLRIQLDSYRRMVEADTEREKLNWTAETYKLVLQAVEEVARRRGVDLLLTYYAAPQVGPSRSLSSFQRDIFLRTVMYRSEGVDLTDEVIRQADQIYASQGGRSAIKILIGGPGS